MNQREDFQVPLSTGKTSTTKDPLCHQEREQTTQTRQDSIQKGEKDKMLRALSVCVFEPEKGRFMP